MGRKPKQLSGYEQLTNSVSEQLDFMSIDSTKITNVESNTGCTWFEVDGKKYYMHIDECAEDELSEE